MPITDQKTWDEFVEMNQDPYGGCCINVAREVMRLLDEDKSVDLTKADESHRLVCQADKNVDAGGITGFMAGCVASMVKQCHSRGNEFNANWNGAHQVGSEGDEATKRGETLNPALLVINVPDRPSHP